LRHQSSASVLPTSQLNPSNACVKNGFFVLIMVRTIRRNARKRSQLTTCHMSFREIGLTSSEVKGTICPCTIRVRLEKKCGGLFGVEQEAHSEKVQHEHGGPSRVSISKYGGEASYDHAEYTQSDRSNAQPSDWKISRW
jgi:hypothetical protein